MKTFTTIGGAQSAALHTAAGYVAPGIEIIDITTEKGFSGSTTPNTPPSYEDGGELE
ncbi:hypothetical protein [uncultured Alistipes sp.]|uniref:hypothetical protein n=1 Tax=uncultured Alistipes sp. TaxID=538949 RepID=UPI0025F0A418|nr:hypothetical protein [uncultured Alistipes sp.]